MSRSHPNTYLGSYPPNRQNNGAPAHIIRHAQQMSRVAGMRPPPNIVAHAEQMVAEQAMRRQVASSQPQLPPPPPPYHLVASTPPVVRPMVVGPMVVQQPIVCQHHPVVHYPTLRMPLYYPPPPPQVYWHAPQQNIRQYPCMFAQPHCGQNLIVPSIQQPMQTSRVLTHHNGTSLIEQLWGEEVSTSNTTASQNTTSTTTQATTTLQQFSSADTATADEGQSSASSPGQPHLDTPPQDPDSDLLIALQTSLTTL